MTCFISLSTADRWLDSWYWTLRSLWKDCISRLLQWYCFGSSLCTDHCRQHHVYPGIHWMYWCFEGKYLPTEICMLSCLIILGQVCLNFLIVSSFSSLQKDCGCSRKCQDYWHFHPFGRSLTTGHEGPNYHPHQNSVEMFWQICHLHHCSDTLKKLVNKGQIHCFPCPLCNLHCWSRCLWPQQTRQLGREG